MQPERLGPYRIERKLGRGGMGAVYVGVDDASSRQVAVKVLSPALASEPGFRQRFDAEIESLKKLMHPGIVRLYGFGEDDDFVFYAMEFVDGPSVEDELRMGRRFDWRETSRVAIQIARALRHAHDCGVIHRDIKPANLLLAADDQVKLSDFGIARLFGQRLTGSGGVLGTAEYMAPEQADGRAITPRCDLYSLGCVMYAMLAGRPPFRADSLPAMLDQHRHAAPRPIRELASDVPTDIERVIHRLLAKSPDDRFSTPQVLVRELEATVDRLTLGSSQILPATPAGSSSSEPRPHDVGETTFIEKTRQDDRGSTDSDAGAPGAALGDVTDLLGPRPRVRYESVDGDARRESPAPAWWRSAWAALPTAIALCGLVALTVVLVRGPSDEELFAEIEQVAADDDDAGLARRERDIDALAARLADDDPRLARLRDLQSAIALAKLERRVARGLPLIERPGEAAPGTTIERLVGDAVRIALLDPPRAAEDLQSVLDLYDTAEASSADTPSTASRKALEIARRQLARLQPIVARQRADERAMVVESLSRAETLRATDPTAARKIWETLVRRFGAQPWAHELLAPARAGLVPETAARGS